MRVGILVRIFNHKPLELLAPAGNLEIFESVVKTNCDAIYFGGQSLNMRMIRKGYNFSDEELDAAVKMAHLHGKKAYVTVNNLIDFQETDVAKRYLTRLAEIVPDAIIVQDFAILSLIKSLELPLELHASVMMNVHNVPMASVLKRHGFTRVVLSRETTLEDVRWIQAQTDLEIEYFTHGDMCIAHGGQCYYSSMLFGMSSNRGKCLKPCRWWFDTSDPDNCNDFPLAVKDLCLYPYLPEMIHAGVTSFKIEGRMREKDFIVTLINHYGYALDRFIEDPIGYERYKDYDKIFESRKRDLSSGYAFGKPGKDNINTRYEGTGKLYSTGKMFSVPTPERKIDQILTEKLRSQLSTTQPPNTRSDVRLSVRVNSIDQAMSVLKSGIDRLYLAADIFKPDTPITLQDIKKLRTHIENENYKHTELYIATPRMMNAFQFECYTSWLTSLKPFIDGILVCNLGAIEIFKSLGLNLIGDYALNIFNPLSADFYLQEGLKQFTPSLELNANDLKVLCENTGHIELVAHGRLSTMYFEHNFHSSDPKSTQQPLKLYNNAGVFEIYQDQHERSHLLSTHRLTLIPVIEEILALNPDMLRIEGQTETPEYLHSIIGLFRNALNGQLTSSSVAALLESGNYSYGALIF